MRARGRALGGAAACAGGREAAPNCALGPDAWRCCASIYPRVQVAQVADDGPRDRCHIASWAARAPAGGWLCCLAAHWPARLLRPRPSLAAGQSAASHLLPCLARLPFAPPYGLCTLAAPCLMRPHQPCKRWCPLHCTPGPRVTRTCLVPMQEGDSWDSYAGDPELQQTFEHVYESKRQGEQSSNRSALDRRTGGLRLAAGHIRERCLLHSAAVCDAHERPPSCRHPQHALHSHRPHAAHSLQAAGGAAKAAAAAAAQPWRPARGREQS